MSRARRVVQLLLALLAFTAVTAPAAADLEDELEQIATEIADLEDRLESAGAERSAAVEDILASQDRLAAGSAQLVAAKAEVGRLRAERRDAEQLLRLIQRKLRATSRDFTETAEQVDATRLEAEEWVRRQYMAAKAGDLVGISLSLDYISDVSNAGAYLARVSAHTDAVLHRYEALRDQQHDQLVLIRDYKLDAAAKAALLNELEAKAEGAQRERAVAVAAVEAELDNQRVLLRRLDHDISHFEGEIAGLEKEQRRLRRLLEKEQRTDGADPPPDPEDDDSGSQEDDASGRFVRPVPGAITSPFGPRRHPILDYIKMHTGVDMAAPLGQNIRAAAGGRVIHADAYGGYGSTVIIDHGAGLATLYAHQSRLEVRYGESVAAGEVIGQAGATGLATGPHLHFEVRLNGRPVDPVPYL